MNFKYIKPLIVSSIINLGLGGFLFIFGILEFLGIADTPANTVYRAIGIQLSFLVFISGLLLLASGGLTLIFRKTMFLVDLQMFIGIAALGWPIFVSIALYFSTRPHVITIRLIPSILAALFYVICILIVKITNEALRTEHKLNTHIGQSGQRKRSINVGAMLTNASGTQKHTGPSINSLRGVAESFQPKNAAAAGAKMLFSGGRRRSRFNPFKLMNGQRRRRGGGLMKRLYSGSRHRRHR